MAIVFTNVMNGDDIRMGEVGNDTCFAQESVAVFRICSVLAIHHLDRHFTIQSLMQGKVDSCHAAFTDDLFDFVARYFHNFKQALSNSLLTTKIVRSPNMQVVFIEFRPIISDPAGNEVMAGVSRHRVPACAGMAYIWGIKGRADHTFR